MKKIGLAVLALSFTLITACKTEPKGSVLTEDEVLQTPEGLDTEAVVLDTIATDIEKAAQSVEKTFQDLQENQQKLDAELDKSIKEASK